MENKESTELAVQNNRKQYIATAYSISEINNQLAEFKQYVDSVMIKDTDYGVIQGTQKPTLFKSGAEKLAFLYNLSAEFELINRIEDWKNEQGLVVPLFSYTYKCKLRHRNTGMIVAEVDGNCNSLEPKYSLKNKYVDGKYAGKEPVENNFDKVNTIIKMSQKRAFVSAVLMATRASYYFTVDLEDMDLEDSYNNKTEPPKKPKRPNTARAEATQNSELKGFMSMSQLTLINELINKKVNDKNKEKFVATILAKAKISTIESLMNNDNGKKIASSIINGLMAMKDLRQTAQEKSEPAIIDGEIEETDPKETEAVDFNELMGDEWEEVK